MTRGVSRKRRTALALSLDADHGARPSLVARLTKPPLVKALARAGGSRGPRPRL
jgi:hypothetical protein